MSSRILGLLLPHFSPSFLLHAGVPVVHGEALCFVGPSGRGKSTLTAEFLRAGHSFLSDELAVIQRGPKGSGFVLARGLPGIRLWPAALRAVPIAGACPRPFVPGFGKKRLSLPGSDKRAHAGEAVPLRAVYLLSRKKKDGISVEALPPGKALLALIEAAYNRIVEAPEILKNQFEVANEVVRTVPVKRLSYPSDFSRLPDVRRAILRDMGF